METEKLIGIASGVVSIGFLAGAMGLTMKMMNKGLYESSKTKKHQTKKIKIKPYTKISMTENYWK